MHWRSFHLRPSLCTACPCPHLRGRRRRARTTRAPCCLARELTATQPASWTSASHQSSRQRAWWTRHLQGPRLQQHAAHSRRECVACVGAKLRRARRRQCGNSPALGGAAAAACWPAACCAQSCRLTSGALQLSAGRASKQHIDVMRATVRTTQRCAARVQHCRSSCPAPAGCLLAGVLAAQSPKLPSCSCDVGVPPAAVCMHTRTHAAHVSRRADAPRLGAARAARLRTCAAGALLFLCRRLLRGLRRLAALPVTEADHSACSTQQARMEWSAAASVRTHACKLHLLRCSARTPGLLAVLSRERPGEGLAARPPAQHCTHTSSQAAWCNACSTACDRAACAAYVACFCWWRPPGRRRCCRRQRRRHPCSAGLQQARACKGSVRVSGQQQLHALPAPPQAHHPACPSCPGRQRAGGSTRRASSQKTWRAAVPDCLMPARDAGRALLVPMYVMREPLRRTRASQRALLRRAAASSPRC